MSAATITPAPFRPPSGVTALDGTRPHPLGSALRAVKVFAEAAFSVVILGEYSEYGEYGEEAGIRVK
ncbi:hypothetical protein QWJ26_34325 [Streptomyces sp. CSDS2]|uniref:hypothetical protein n=1 Tax=Streptomyces sp. CSDS2 TaxID=3055051 RepID=UPI0025AF10F3|nr:hypothetical protein [Streptomyces sp. CSDS2]MDN3264790.1 hypothetical protein [Streptomyces sp. CSDS2]